MSYCPVFKIISPPIKEDLLVQPQICPVSFLSAMQHSFVYLFPDFLWLDKPRTERFLSCTEGEFVSGMLHAERLMPFNLRWRSSPGLLVFRALQHWNCNSDCQQPCLRATLLLPCVILGDKEISDIKAPLQTVLAADFNRGQVVSFQGSPSINLCLLPYFSTTCKTSGAMELTAVGFTG